MDQALLAQLKQESLSTKRPAAHLVRDLIADHFSYYGLPAPMLATLEQDRKERGLDRRQYLIFLLGDRYQQLLLNGHA